jgi:hypothetical protein
MQPAVAVPVGRLPLFSKRPYGRVKGKRFPPSATPYESRRNGNNSSPPAHLPFEIAI